MGGPICFEELSVQITPPSTQGRPTGWHRDRAHWLEHPLHLDYPQIIYYLSDVAEGNHHFTLSPEPADGEVLDKDAQLARGGSVPFYGKAGSGILFNASILHGATIAQTEQERRILQVYYGHPQRPPLAEVSLIPGAPLARRTRSGGAALLRQTQPLHHGHAPLDGRSGPEAAAPPR